MDSNVIEKPYRFIAPHHGNLWPWMIQHLRLYDYYLRKSEGVVDYELRHPERLRASLDSGCGILLAPNHCRYADPLVLGWLARKCRTHLYAMASWHLFNKHWFDTFAIPKMGGFSVWREGPDRQGIETAIEVIAAARRPLLVFPEGTAYRTNDLLQPLLDGVAFIARAAARRRMKHEHRPVVIHPMGIKYVFRGDLDAWSDAALSRLEERLSWRTGRELPLLRRVARIAEGLLALKEIEYLGGAQNGSVHTRQRRLIDHLLIPIAERYRISNELPVVPRIKALRPKMVPRLLAPETSEAERAALRRELADLDLAQQLASYPEGYLSRPPVTETRVLETIERMEEDLLGESSWPGPLRAVIEVAPAIEVPTERAPRGESDPLLTELRTALEELLDRLQYEARPLSGQGEATAVTAPRGENGA